MESTSPHLYESGVVSSLLRANVTTTKAGSARGGASRGYPQSAIGVPSAANTAPTAVSGPAGGTAEAELTELTSTEISLDLQGLIEDTAFTDDNLFENLIEAKKHELNHGYGLHHRTSPAVSLSSTSGAGSPTGGHESPPANYVAYNRNALAYLPGSVHNAASYAPSGAAAAAAAIQVKQEPSDHGVDYAKSAAACAQMAVYGGASNAFSSAIVSSTTPSHNGLVGAGAYPSSASAMKGFPGAPGRFPPQPHSHSLGVGGVSGVGGAGGVGGGLHPAHPVSKKKVDRGSDEYRRRRERNNVAVRKSREKAKARSRETEERVKYLARENDRLQKKVELLQEELSVLRSLFSNVGVLPDHIHRELSKHMDSFAQQHNAMACM